MTDFAKGNKVTDLLTADDKQMMKSKNFLTLLARRVMYDMNLTPRQFFPRVEHWLKNMFKDDHKRLSNISTNRNNFFNEVTNDAMTANTFQKFTQAMGASRVKIKITMEFPDGRHDHESTIIFSNSTIDPLEEEKAHIAEEVEQHPK